MMHPTRRAWLSTAALAPMLPSMPLAWAALPGPLGPGPGPGPGSGPASAARPDNPTARALAFPRDHGAHLDAAIEWWYATGWLQAQSEAGLRALLGFQITFFRSRTGLAQNLPGRFAPRHLLFAHAALTILPTQGAPDNATNGATRSGTGNTITSAATRAAAHLGSAPAIVPQHLHGSRVARWNGDDRAANPLNSASTHDADVRMGPWMLQRRLLTGAAYSSARALVAPRTDGASGMANAEGAVYSVRLPPPQEGADLGFGFDLNLATTQPLLLQGDQGYSLKAPHEPPSATSTPNTRNTPKAPGATGSSRASPTAVNTGPTVPHASRYYSEPQLQASGLVQAPGLGSMQVQGRAWLDHEWSDALLHPQAVGWDWVGINGDDGSALTVFQLRRADGSVLWAGGSFRRGGGTAATQAFAAESVQWQALRRWRSAASNALYPVHWQLQTPVGRFQLRSLLDAQELDARHNTGTVYWEGLSELLNEAGERVGLGYLEMTGYAGALKLGT